MDIQGKTVLITGANRGIGKAYAEEFLKSGAKKIYIGSRDISNITNFIQKAPDILIPLKLDVTNKQDIENAAKIAGDIDILINNAGILLAEEDLINDIEAANNAAKQFEVNYNGPLRMTQAFAPLLKKNGGGVNVIVSSIAGHVVFPGLATYCASKFATSALILALRQQLKSQSTRVIGVYPGPIDTDMGKAVDMEKSSPALVAQKTIEAILKGEEDVFPDPVSQGLYEDYRADHKALEQQMIDAAQDVQDAA